VKADLTKRLMAIVRCWRAMPQVNQNRDIDKLFDFAFAHTIAPDQIRSELMQLVQIVVDMRPERVLEIGTCAGGTLFLWCHVAAPDATIISVDLPHGRFGAGYSPARIPLYKRFALPKQKLSLVRGDSHAAETLERVQKLVGRQPLDFLFIDGDHTYEGVKKDFEMYSPLVKKGGAIAFHDISPHPRGWGGEVPRFWNEIKSGYSSKEFMAQPGNGYGIGTLFT
jgi:predicted O-methyltransferase YrrM